MNVKDRMDLDIFSWRKFPSNGWEFDNIRILPPTAYAVDSEDAWLHHVQATIPTTHSNEKLKALICLSLTLTKSDRAGIRHIVYKIIEQLNIICKETTWNR